MNINEFASKYIKDTNSRILEFGPLTRCLLDKKRYKNYFFADIRSTEEVKKLYSGNEYLKRTGIKVDIKDVIEIDYVIKGSYKETFKGVEKFDYIIVSHVLEHIPNLLNFFIDLQNILKKGGEIIILYPDRRYCFDHFRTDSKFSEIYHLWRENKFLPYSQILDFYSNVIPENRPQVFWTRNILKDFESKGSEKKDIEIYEKARKGIIEDDIHYWPFSDFAFLKFLYDCKRYKIFPFSLRKFIPTQENTQQFLVILSNIENNNFNELKKAMIKAKNEFGGACEIGDKGTIQKYISENKNLYDTIQQLERSRKELNQQLQKVKFEYQESQRVRNLLAQLIKKVTRVIKRILFYLPIIIIKKFNDK